MRDRKNCNTEKLIFSGFRKGQAMKTKQKEENTRMRENRESEQKEETKKWEGKSSLLFTFMIYSCSSAGEGSALQT